MRRPLLVGVLLAVGCGSTTPKMDGGSGGNGGTGGNGGGSGGGCSAATCPGCCYNGTCQPGNTVTACGASGASCSACKSYENCPANACAINPESTWDVVAVSATFDTTVTWDPGGGAPDPKLCLDMPVGTPVKCSTLKGDVFTATWNETIATGVKASLLKGDGYRVVLVDDDPIGVDIAGDANKLPDSAFHDGAYTASGFMGKGSTSFSIGLVSK